MPTKTVNTISTNNASATKKVVIENPDIRIINRPERVQKIKDTVLDLIDKDPTFVIGQFVRNLSSYGFNSLDEKSQACYFAVDYLNQKNIYPYNRHLLGGSQSETKVQDTYLTSDHNCVIWCTNHYLGLNRNPKVINEGIMALKKYGTGCGTSAVSGGFSDLHKMLEEKIAKLVKKEEAVLFPTGYSANVGFISTIITSADLILFDRDCHASIIEGIRLSGATYRYFKHNDPTNLDQLLSKESQTLAYNNVFVITESVFSMSGEEAPLREICALKDKYPFYLFVDEAHSFGFYGENGAGLGEHLGCLDKIDVIMSTLSKSLASIGGFFAASKEICSLSRISSNAYLFQACIPPVDVAVALASLNYFHVSSKPRMKLWESTLLFRSELNRLGFNTGKSKSPATPIYIHDESKLSAACLLLFEEGVYTNWITFPAVKKGRGCLRFIVTANHTLEQIQFTIKSLEKVGKALSII